MFLRKGILALAVVAALMNVSVEQSRATATPVYLGTSSSAALSAGAAATTGFLGFVAILCIYDIWLKFNGVKNWDGSPKVVVVHHH
jgi:hypothetical protein